MWAALLSLLPIVTASSSSKRGLVFISSTKDSTTDAPVWFTNTDLTWYYNYGAYPSQQLRQSALHFVPMLWGAPDDKNDTSFLDSVRSRKLSGENITHVLAMNEPDMKKDVGGSDISPSDAASVWLKQIQPLKALGIKVSAPVVSGSPSGYSWLKSWQDQCDGECNPDFMPIHWYGPFAGFASWVGNMTTTYPNLEIWVTEFGLPNADLISTQVFYNESINMLDGWSNVSRYAYFGSFRSDSSNIGPAAAMLTNEGQLTDIGSWYLGGNATGAKPEGSGCVKSRSTVLFFLVLLAHCLLSI
ncbi:uncharacterized protein PV09_03639 [Verruconis gallopava]|uniref:Asl1-like glycosyl hydrolase catalytic domain-containing protein n=1 Tax=Verruconis gallopava TaxID=253628 RepID=A0A0D2B3B3_9PEZI|nr:uncharacterized protein PV09_03639 [Verruconis gallopava]KIW05784.1 hypothetical protein PV09_03639 [Verruconis gallopava]